MSAFLTGLAAVALLSITTWLTLQTYTVTMTERHEGTSVIVQEDDSLGKAWK
jgi:hypothetical protein